MTMAWWPCQANSAAAMRRTFAWVGQAKENDSKAAFGNNLAAS